MVENITKKIAELKGELAKQRFTDEDNKEIDKIVEDYRQELKNEREQEYAYNVQLINAKIEVLEELRKEELDSQVVEETNPATPMI